MAPLAALAKPREESIPTCSSIVLKGFGIVMNP